MRRLINYLAYRAGRLSRNLSCTLPIAALLPCLMVALCLPQTREYMAGWPGAVTVFQIAFIGGGLAVAGIALLYLREA